MPRTTAAGLKALCAPRPLDRATQRVGAFSALPALIRELGADARVVLAVSGLDGDALDDPESRIEYAALGRLLAESAVRTGCEHLGLLVGRMWHLGDLGLPGELTRFAPTVGEALRYLTVYQHLNSEAVVPFVHRTGTVADFGCAIYGSDLVGVAHLSDMYLAAAVNFMRELCGASWKAAEVLLPHASPRNAAHYGQFFKAPTRFNADVCALRFPARLLTRDVPGANPARLAAAHARARTTPHPDLQQAVLRALRVLMLDGRCSGDDVARVLSMHRRTLNRRLQALGLTFQDMLDTVRFDLARQLLSESNIALDEVAAVLGYSGISPFMRTFRRWTGTTPNRWRCAARATALPARRTTIAADVRASL